MKVVDSIGGLGFPEALRWRDGELWFSDMFRGRVMRWRPGREPVVVLDQASGCPRTPGGLGWLPDGTLLVVDCQRRLVLAARKHVTVHADLSGLVEFNANDMVVDSVGIAWVGSYGFDVDAGEQPRPVALAWVEPDGTAGLTEQRFTFPNGMEFTADGELVVAETYADTVRGLRNDTARTIATLPTGSGPDGLALLPQGGAWIALAFAGRAVEIGADGATIRDYVPAGAGLGVYDCAVLPAEVGQTSPRLAVAIASLNESLALVEDTGRIEIIDLQVAS